MTDVLSDALDKIRSVLDVETVVGKPVVNNECVRVIPISKMSLGIAGLGGEMPGKSPKSDKELPLGGVGAGATIQPVGFLVVSGERVKFINLEGGESKWESCIENVIEFFSRS